MEGLKKIRKDAFLKGLLLGILLIVFKIALINIVASSQSFLTIALSYLFAYVVILLTAVIVLIKKLRTNAGGYWNLRQATSGIFILFAIAYILSTAVSAVYVKHIDTQISDKSKNNFVSLYSNLLEKLKAEPDKIDEAIEMIEESHELSKKTTIGDFFTGMLISIIILFIVALIFAAIFKNEERIHAEV